MRQDITSAQPREHLEPARRRVVEMRHDREPGLGRDFEGDVERCHPGGAPGIAPDPDLDTGDQLAVGVDNADAFARVEKPQIGAFADHHTGAKGEDAGKRDIQERDDAQRRRLDHEAPKAMEIAGAGAAGINESRRSASSCDLGRVDAERGATPIDMRVQIDQPGHHQEPTRLDDLGAVGGQIATDLDHLAIVKGDVCGLVSAARRIDQAAAFQDQIRHDRPLPSVTRERGTTGAATGR